MVDYICYPKALSDLDLGLNETNCRYRKVLKILVYGELGTMLGNGLLFGLFEGLIQLCAMYIDYAAYANMKPCQVMLMGFIATWEIAFYILGATNSGHDEEMIN